MTKTELIQGLAPYPDDTIVVLILTETDKRSALCYDGDVTAKRFAIFADSILQPGDS